VPIHEQWQGRDGKTAPGDAPEDAGSEWRTTSAATCATMSAGFTVPAGDVHPEVIALL
jgi:hypothetical protein